MKFTTTTVKTAVGAAGIAAVSVFAAATASAAPPNIQGFGASESLIDGPMVTSYTVSNLQPSTMAIPGYTPKGTLYQADIVARSDGGTCYPAGERLQRPRAQRSELQADRQGRGPERP